MKRHHCHCSTCGSASGGGGPSHAEPPCLTGEFPRSSEVPRLGRDSHGQVLQPVGEQAHDPVGSFDNTTHQ